jgi:hypothetical protein
MYLRVTERRNRDGSTVAYYALAENLWNATSKRSEARVVHSFGRADQLDRAALQRLVASIQRVIDADAADTLPTRGKTAIPEIEIDAVFDLGIVLVARRLWEQLGIGEALRTRLDRADLTAPHEMALFAMAAQRLDDPGSKRGCATRWLPDIAWLPEAGKLAVDQLYRALDFLAVWSDEIERDVFLRSADLLRLDVDLIFYDTTTAYFEIDEADERDELWAGRLFAPTRSQQGGPGPSAAGYRRPGGHTRRHAGAVLGAAGKYRRCHHGGAHQGGFAGLAAGPLRLRRRRRDVLGRQPQGPVARSLHPGGADAQGEGCRGVDAARALPPDRR